MNRKHSKAQRGGSAEHSFVRFHRNQTVGFFYFMKKETFYFSHDYNSANDIKILFMRQQLGMEGYGIFWYLVETLANAGGRLPIAIAPVLAMQIQVTEIKVRAVIEQFGLFVIDNGEFFSQRLNEHLETRKKLSLKGKEGANKRWIDRVPIGDANGVAIGVPNAKERKGKENKGKEIKVNCKFEKPTKIEIVQYLFDEKNMDEFQADGFADRFFSYYESNGWMVGRNKMKNWKMAVNTWISNQQNKNQQNDKSTTRINQIKNW